MTYTLQTNIVVDGTIIVKLHTTETGLTIPAYNSLKFTGKLKEKIDERAGVYEVENISMTFNDDFTNYAEGFWYKVYLADPKFEIQILLDEGDGPTTVFWGRPVLGGVIFEEISIISGSLFRQGRMTLVSLYDRLADVSVSDFITEVNLHLETLRDAAPSDQQRLYVLVHSIIASAHKLAHNQTFSLNDVIFEDTDVIQYQGKVFTTWDGIDTIYVNVDNGYWLSSHDYYFGRAFANTKEIINVVLHNIGYIPRYYYDDAASRHRLKLITRRNSSTLVTMSGAIVKSSIIVDEDIYIKTFKVTPLKNDVTVISGVQVDESKYAIRYDPFLITIPEVKAGPVKQAISFDVDYIVLWGHGANTDADRHENFFRKYFASGSDRAELAEDTRVSGSGATNVMYTTLVRYYYPQLANPTPTANGVVSRKVVIERQYASLKANNGMTNSHLNIYVTRRTSINDGVSTRTFYATEVEKDLVLGYVTVRWALSGIQTG